MKLDEERLKALMVAGLEGDRVAHEALLRALSLMLAKYFRSKFRHNPNDIDDFVQETLIAIHERRATFDRERLFLPWLYAIAKYKAIDHLRKVKRHRAETIDDYEPADDRSAIDDHAIAQIDVERLLETLTPKQAQAIRDTKIEGLSVTDAADRADLSPSDIKVSVHRGLKSLMRRVQSEER